MTYTVLAQVMSIYQNFTGGIYKVTHFTFEKHFLHKPRNFKYVVLAMNLCTIKICLHGTSMKMQYQ